MKPTEYLDLINNLEKQYPVCDWSIDGIHIWPLYRHMLSQKLHNLEFKQKDKSLKKSSFILIKNAVFNYLKATISDRNHNQKTNKPVDSVFFTNSKVRVRIKDSWYDRICDPIIDKLEKNNKNSFVFEMVHDDNYKYPRYRKSCYIQFIMYPYFMKAGVKYLYQKKFKSSTECSSLNKFNNMICQLESMELGLKIPDFNDIIYELNIILSIKSFFLRKLKKLKPSIAFILCYYARRQYAFTLACKELNITTVDIQHGVQGELHRAYGRWLAVPDSGYELLPEVFLNWDEKDAESINKWSKNNSHHKALVGGNPWVDMWKDENFEFNNFFDKKIDLIKSKIKQDTHILVTLQQETLADPEWLIDLIKKSPENCFWWIRLHQSMLSDMDKMKKILQETGQDNYELNTATDFPLFSLLRNVDVHVTMYSTCIIEAKNFGIPSVITHPNGKEMFHYYVCSGWALPAFTSENIFKAINLQNNKHLITDEELDVKTRIQHTYNSINEYLNT